MLIPTNRSCLCLSLIFTIVELPVVCCDCIAQEDSGHCQSIPLFNNIKLLLTLTGSKSTCNKNVPCCRVDMDRRGKKSKRNKSIKGSENIQQDDNESCSTPVSPAKKRNSVKVAQEDHPSLTSQDSDETLQYTAGASYPEYDDKDFCSGDSSDDSAEERVNIVKSKPQAVEISDNSSDDVDEAVNSPWKQVLRNKGKGKMQQTTLKFASKNKNVVKNEAKGKATVTRSRFKYSDFDTAEYRDGYPNKKDDPTLNDNWLFYEGSIPSRPDGQFIQDIHQNWFGRYRRLEELHGYIQWLFPIRENGMNWQAQALQLHEAKAIRSNKETKLRVLASYRLMLDFYGMKLVDPDSGRIERSKSWRERFENLKWSSHNYLRITRILKSLGELGYEHLKKPFLEFVLHEALVERTLERLLRSCEDYWIGTIKDDADRELLHKFIEDRKRW